jgi:DNA-binding GntR family transcriptional regulator
MRTDLTYCVENLLLISGYQVQIEALANGQVPATKEESVDLKIGEGSNLLQLQILTRADGKPAALEIHRIPMHHLKQELPNGLEVLKLEEFLWDYCERELAHEMTSWIPTLVDKRFSTLFDLTQGSAMLYWEELLYDTDDTPVCHTYTYFNPNIIKPRSLRKWNFGPRLDEKL